MPYHVPTLAPYGIIRKVRGQSGELILSLLHEEYLDIDPEYLFISIDGIPVPFRLLDLRGTWDNLIVELEMIESGDDAERFRGAQVLVDQSLIQDCMSSSSPNSIKSLLGYTFLHPTRGYIGKLSDVDSSTANILLLIVDDEGVECCLPLVDSWFCGLDPDNRCVTYACPEELMALNHNQAD